MPLNKSEIDELLKKEEIVFLATSDLKGNPHVKPISRWIFEFLCYNFPHFLKICQEKKEGKTGSHFRMFWVRLCPMIIISSERNRKGAIGILATGRATTLEILAVGY